MKNNYLMKSNFKVVSFRISVNIQNLGPQPLLNSKIATCPM